MTAAKPDRQLDAEVAAVVKPLTFDGMIPAYSTDWAAMGSLLGELRERGWQAKLISVGRMSWVACLSKGKLGAANRRYFESGDMPLPRAVAEAALAALGGEGS